MPKIKHEEDEIIIYDERIGKGCYSVYKGTWKGIVAAFKDMDTDLAGRNADQIWINYVAELKFLMHGIKHRNIVEFLGVCSLERPRYLATKLCEKGDFKKVTDDPNVVYNVAHVIQWGVQLFDGLLHLHINNIKHRDIKRQNILLGDSNEVKITDFGLMKDKDTETMTKLATARYMAPETMSYANAKGEFTDKSDVYSAALVLWEIAEREKVFKDIDSQMVFSEVRRKENPLRLQPAHCFKKLADIIHRCCEQFTIALYFRCSDLEKERRLWTKDCWKELKSFKKLTLYNQYKTVAIDFNSKNEEIIKPIGINDLEKDDVGYQSSEDETFGFGMDELKECLPTLPFDIGTNEISKSSEIVVKEEWSSEDTEATIKNVPNERSNPGQQPSESQRYHLEELRHINEELRQCDEQWRIMEEEKRRNDEERRRWQDELDRLNHRQLEIEHDRIRGEIRRQQQETIRHENEKRQRDEEEWSRIEEQMKVRGDALETIEMERRRWEERKCELPPWEVERLRQEDLRQKAEQQREEREKRDRERERNQIKAEEAARQNETNAQMERRREFLENKKRIATEKKQRILKLLQHL